MQVSPQICTTEAMSRNSKKGFKKLNTHELVELNSHGRADSGSENEILDLTTIDEHEPHNSCCSRCGEVEMTWGGGVDVKSGGVERA